MAGPHPRSRQPVLPRSFSAYETKPTYGTMVVSRVYAATWCDQNPIAIDEDHSAIVKPENTQADIYVLARGALGHEWSRRRHQKLSEAIETTIGNYTTVYRCCYHFGRYDFSRVLPRCRKSRGATTQPYVSGAFLRMESSFVVG